MIQVPYAFFDKIELAIWILDRSGQVLHRTMMAKNIEQQYEIDISIILAISRGEAPSLIETDAGCLKCPIHDMIFSRGFPFVLKHHEGAFIDFWGQTTTDDQYIYLQIKEKLYADSINKNRLLLEYLNEVREEEQKRIALDLHDSIAQSVYSLMLEVRSLKWLSEQQQFHKLNEIDQHFSLTLQEIKNLARQLRPISIDEVGLVSALKQFIVRHEEMTGFEVDLSITGKEPILSDQIRIAIYRVIQEAITNAMKYSGENICYVYLQFNPSDMLITIKDEGIGFDTTKERNGFGLYNIQERIYALKGSITISSRLSQGTQITLKMPYQIGGASL